MDRDSSALKRERERKKETTGRMERRENETEIEGKRYIISPIDKAIFVAVAVVANDNNLRP